MNTIEVVGWIGSFLYIFTYYLLGYKIIKKDKLYYLLNAIAAVLVTVLSLYKNTLQPIIVNVVWFCISIRAYYGRSDSIKIVNSKVLYYLSVCMLSISFITLLFFSIELSFEILAWFSVLSFIGSYFLYSLRKIKDKTFHVYNFFAALSIIPNMVLHENYQVVFLECLWAFFALQAYLKRNKMII